MEIKRVGFEDDRELTYLLKTALDVKEVEERLGFEDYVHNGEYIEVLSKYLIAASASEYCYLAVVEDEGKLVGGIVGEVVMAGGLLTHQFTGFIKLIYMEEEYRRSSVATELVNEFEAWCVGMGVRDMEASIYSTNTAPQEGLVKLGWRTGFITMTKKIGGEGNE